MPTSPPARVGCCVAAYLIAWQPNLYGAGTLIRTPAQTAGAVPVQIHGPSAKHDNVMASRVADRAFGVLSCKDGESTDLRSTID
jgi:hypothetical protein